MKRYWALGVLFVSITLMFLMVGCGEGNVSINQDELKIEDLTISVDSGKDIHLGMSRVEIEKILGNGEDNGFVISYGKVAVGYNNDKAIYIASVPIDEGIKFMGSIKLGVKKSEIDNILGDSNSPSKNPIDYFYKLNGSKLKKEYTDPTKLNSKSSTYIDISFNFGENEKDDDRQLEGFQLINVNEFMNKK